MNIGLAHFRVGETDGVSLEMEKWRKVLEKMGHKVFFISGTPNYGEIYIPEMNFHSERFKRIEYNAYRELRDYSSEEEFKKDILKEAKIIEEKLTDAVKRNSIDVLVPNNIFSLGVALPVAIAFARVIRNLGLKAIAHNHDFYWEREVLSKPTCDFVKECLEEYYPPKDENVKQVVINEIARKELFVRKGLRSTVVPNVFDFEQPLWKSDDFNYDLREKLGISTNDIVFLQATRVTDRKAIELAIEVVGEVSRRRNELYGTLYDGRKFTSDDRIVMLMPGLIETATNYDNFLREVAAAEGVEVVWCNQMMGAERQNTEGQKMYSLWDMYVIADMITYPSILEGWGNQFLEALFSKKNMIVFEYPVYLTDIKPLGFEVISLGEKYSERSGTGYVEIPREKIVKAAKETIELLKNKEEYSRRAEKNFSIGQQHLSYKTLEEKLRQIISSFNS
ncbi:glycosyl transferase family 1 [Kosmotoga arenicorallina S304]|uniref:Glycosyl transferase family 1 n=1 Tax=Kosmotoga arenicorallina S304 TaxID=1453497 RepID=A0A182C7L7_9BACT|nr:glycosyltransferase family 4 protein [Kosmotoga arenicorallina]OAA31618.1 glycosyl transferase family 1 [Kosmotoga arenicorallina S304]